MLQIVLPWRSIALMGPVVMSLRPEQVLGPQGVCLRRRAELSSTAPRNRCDVISQGTVVTSPLRGLMILSCHIGESPHQNACALNSDAPLRYSFSQGEALTVTGVPGPDALIGYRRCELSFPGGPS